METKTWVNKNIFILIMKNMKMLNNIEMNPNPTDYKKRVQICKFSFVMAKSPLASPYL